VFVTCCKTFKLIFKTGLRKNYDFSRFDILIWKDFAKVSKNLARYRSENNFN